MHADKWSEPKGNGQKVVLLNSYKSRGEDQDSKWDVWHATKTQQKVARHLDMRTDKEIVPVWHISVHGIQGVEATWIEDGAWEAMWGDKGIECVFTVHSQSGQR